MYIQATRTNRELAHHQLNRLSRIRNVGSAPLDQIVIGECIVGSIQPDEAVEIIGFSSKKTPAIVTRVYTQLSRHFLHLDRRHPFRPGMIISSTGDAEPTKVSTASFREGEKKDKTDFTLDLDKEVVKIFDIEIPCTVGIRGGTSNIQEWEIDLDEWTYIPAGWSFSVTHGSSEATGYGEVQR